MSTTLENGDVLFGDGTRLSSASIGWGSLSGIPGLVYSNVKNNGNEQAGRAVYGGNINGWSYGGYGNAGQNCGPSTFNCSGGQLNLDTGSGWDMYYYYYNCNCNCQCDCNCDCNCNCNC